MPCSLSIFCHLPICMYTFPLLCVNIPLFFHSSSLNYSCYSPSFCLSCLTLPHLALSHFVCPILPQLALPCPVFSCLALPCFALPWPISLHLALPCTSFALSHPASPCLSLPCLTLPCLASALHSLLTQSNILAT
jgi:hypothetical protein